MYEFFLCPVHGVFGAANWPLIAPAIAGVLVVARQVWSCVVGFARKF